MDQLLSNPRGIVILCCVTVLVVGLNLTLIGVLRGDKRFQREATRFTQALGGGRDVRLRNEAAAAELNRLVKQLKDHEQKGPDQSSDG